MACAAAAIGFLMVIFGRQARVAAIGAAIAVGAFVMMVRGG
jgi:hypothetical protein